MHEGRKIIEKLVERSDVLVENFVPGKLASMGLGWEACQKINPRLIYTSISGKLSGYNPTTTSDLLRVWSIGSVQREARV
jgi:crotonobetainyl-CoA:carnitine CoA-transferase CaiB-like acyl-CoA transferase